MNEQMPIPENNIEKFKEINLEIKEPDKVHGLEIIFDEQDIRLISVYNIAIKEICNDEKNLGMFHQTGIVNDPGYHAWEVLGSANDSEKLLKLLPLIHKKAKETYVKFDEMNLFE